MRTAWLQVRMGLTVLLLFAVIYALLAVVATVAGVGTPLVYAVLALGLVSVQFLIGPKVVELTMRIRYVSEAEQPELHRIVSDLAMKAGIPKPRVGISEIQIPNAFAFGTSKRNARVCVTRRLLEMLNRDELEAVLGHELSHIKHRDMVVITALSVIPMICYLSTSASSGPASSAAVGAGRAHCRRWRSRSLRSSSISSVTSSCCMPPAFGNTMRTRAAQS